MSLPSGSGVGAFSQRRPPAGTPEKPRRGFGRISVVKLEEADEYWASWQDGDRVDDCSAHDPSVVSAWIRQTGICEIVVDPRIARELGLK